MPREAKLALIDLLDKTKANFAGNTVLFLSLCPVFSSMLVLFVVCN